MMRNWIQAGVVAAAATLALAIAGGAFAAVAPKLTVTTTNAAGGPRVTISASERSTDDSLARLQIYIPSGVGLKAPANGVTVGTALIRAIPKDVKQDEAQLKGTVVAISPADPAVAYEGATCDTGQHAAAWMVQLNGASGKLSFPIFVDATAGSETQFGTYKLVACLRSPELAPGTANRSPNGMKLNSMVLSLKGFGTPTTAGDHRWRSLWTPFTTGTANMNTAANVEAQSIDRAPPGALSIYGKKTTLRVKGQVFSLLTISGQVLVGGESPGVMNVALRHGATSAHLVGMRGTKTNGGGIYTKVVLLKKPTFFQTRVTLLAGELGAAGCLASFGAGVPCLDATAAGKSLVSGLMFVKP